MADALELGPPASPPIQRRSPEPQDLGFEGSPGEYVEKDSSSLVSPPLSKQGDNEHDEGEEMENGEIVEEVEEGETDDADGELTEVSPPPMELDRHGQLEKLRSMQFKSTRLPYPTRERHREPPTEDGDRRSSRHPRSDEQRESSHAARYANSTTPSRQFAPPTRDRSPRERYEEDRTERGRKRRLEDDDYRERERQRRRVASPQPSMPPMGVRREPPATLRQRTQQLFDVADSRLMALSKNDILAHIRRCFELDSEHRRMVRGRNEQIKELNKMKQSERETVERLSAELPPHLRPPLAPNGVPEGLRPPFSGPPPPFVNGIAGPPPPMTNGRPPMGLPPGMLPPGVAPPPLGVPPDGIPPQFPGGPSPFGAPPPVSIVLANPHIPPPHIVVSRPPPVVAAPQPSQPPRPASTPPGDPESAESTPGQAPPSLPDFSKPPPALPDLSQPPPTLPTSSSSTPQKASSSLPDFSVPPPIAPPNFPPGQPPASGTGSSSTVAAPPSLLALNRPPPGFTVPPGGKASAPYLGAGPFPFPPPGPGISAPPPGMMPSLLNQQPAAPNPINLSKTLTSMIASAVGAAPGGQPARGPTLGNTNPFGANIQSGPIRLMPNFNSQPQRTFTTTKVFNGPGKRNPQQKKTPVKGDSASSDAAIEEETQQAMGDFGEPTDPKIEEQDIDSVIAEVSQVSPDVDDEPAPDEPEAVAQQTYTSED